ncbi:MAG: 16S rRNA (guanine(527)-N(7))-methyltransferase RsmG [Hyphomicrobiaceae bacterium]
MSSPNDGPPIASIRTAQDFAQTFDVSRETLECFEVFEDLLRQWQGIKNLVAANSLDDVWLRHFADSAQLLALKPNAQKWLDLGTGAGFPGMVLAILLRNDSAARVTVVESNGRKCAFLRDVARQTGVAVDIVSDRIESVAEHRSLAGVEVVTARALAPLGKLLGYAAPFFSASTSGLFLKGRDALKEIKAARKDWRFEVELHPSLTDGNGRIVEIRKLGSI